MIEFSAAFKNHNDEAFCKIVRTLICRSHLDNFDIPFLHMIPEEVPFHIVIVSTTCNPLVCGKKESTAIIFVYCSIDGVVYTMKVGWNVYYLNKF